MDVIDEAQQLDADRRDDALAARRTRHTASHLPGICRDCGDGIDPARLTVLPNATRCLDCQKAAERIRRE